ncbi:hypothetical protein NQ176_g851 [Zarea fungicola]|uniref:Uncharacterized protein n=1 Tax=Zarea fungicola TaxID=93591 RepID=A0ACC1NVY8_9HYPO|nr:hypothetical protein NQ176_g851 [Lecanicillium fungicola]
MRFTPSILLAAGYAAAGVTASPASTAAVEIAPGLFMETHEFGEVALDSSRSIGDAPADGGLTKRQHVDCWDNHMTVRQNQEAYEDDCDNLIEGLRRRSSTTRQLNPNSSLTYRTDSFRCKIIVRNQSSCSRKTLVDSWAGADGRNTLNNCPSLSQCSGWGYVNNDPQLVYIIEPYEVSPPAYSPRC